MGSGGMRTLLPMAAGFAIPALGPTLFPSLMGVGAPLAGSGGIAGTALGGAAANAGVAPAIGGLTNAAIAPTVGTGAFNIGSSALAPNAFMNGILGANGPLFRSFDDTFDMLDKLGPMSDFLSENNQQPQQPMVVPGMAPGVQAPQNQSSLAESAAPSFAQPVAQGSVPGVVPQDMANVDQVLGALAQALAANANRRPGQFGRMTASAA